MEGVLDLTSSFKRIEIKIKIPWASFPPSPEVLHGSAIFRKMDHIPGESHLLQEVLQVIEKLKIHFVCGKKTPGDGSCLFHGVMDQIDHMSNPDTYADYLTIWCTAIFLPAA